MLELDRNLFVLRRWWWLILLGTVIGGLVAYGATKVLARPMYQATAIVALSPITSDSEFPMLAASADAQLVTTLATSSDMHRLVPEVSARNLESNISSVASLEGQLLYVQVRWPDAALAPKLANDLASVFVSQEKRRLESRYRILHAGVVTQEAHLTQLLGSGSSSGSGQSWLHAQYADQLSKLYQDDVKARTDASLQEQGLQVAVLAQKVSSVGARASVNAVLGAALGFVLTLVLAFVLTTSYGESTAVEAPRGLRASVAE